MPYFLVKYDMTEWLVSLTLDKAYLIFQAQMNEHH